VIDHIHCVQIQCRFRVLDEATHRWGWRYDLFEICRLRDHGRIVPASIGEHLDVVDAPWLKLGLIKQPGTPGWPFVAEDEEIRKCVEAGKRIRDVAHETGSDGGCWTGGCALV
jgi:hypothetical protein